jgi:hypothetical protein
MESWDQIIKEYDAVEVVEEIFERAESILRDEA